ncbi:MAG: hypothetical protein U1A22_04780 [Xanthomonadaceae bacterium]|nr:hypothetical protein [Xanthomonadaceae bacterium]
MKLQNKHGATQSIPAPTPVQIANAKPASGDTDKTAALAKKSAKAETPTRQAKPPVTSGGPRSRVPNAPRKQS